MKKKFKKVVEGTEQNKHIITIGIYSLMVLWFTKSLNLGYVEVSIFTACLIVLVLIGLEYERYWEEE